MHASASGLRKTFPQMPFIQDQNYLFWVAMKQRVMTLHEEGNTQKQNSIYIKMMPLSSADGGGISPTLLQYVCVCTYVCNK